MKIIGGIVSFEDGIKTIPGDNFSPTRKVSVELNFSLDDGDDGDKMIASVLDKAQTFVNGKLNLTVPTAAAKTTVKQEAKTTAAPVTPKEPTGKDKLAAAAGLTDELTQSTAAPKAPRAPRKAADKAQTDLEDLTGSSAAELNDGLDDLLGEAPKEITDADLNEAVQKCNGRINTAENPGGVRIRKTAAEFLPEGKQPVLMNIPQASRAAFLKKLDELK